MFSKFHFSPISVGGNGSENSKVEIFFGDEKIGEYDVSEVAQKVLDEANSRGWKQIVVKLDDGTEIEDLGEIEAGDKVFVSPYYSQG